MHLPLDYLSNNKNNQKKNLNLLLYKGTNQRRLCHNIKQFNYENKKKKGGAYGKKNNHNSKNSFRNNQIYLRQLFLS